MMRAIFSGFGFGPYQKRCNRSRTRISVLVMVALLTFGIVALPVDRAWAGSTLEIPSAAPTSAPDTIPASTPTNDPVSYTDNTPVPGTGTADDYMHQPGDPGAAHSRYASGSGSGYAYNAPADPQSNQPDLMTAALVGGAIIGLIALSNYTAHHRHR